MRLTMLAGSVAVICAALATRAPAQGIPRTEIKLDDSYILGVRARVDQEELESARLAATRGSTKEVRDFAQSLLRGHAAAQVSAKNLAEQMKVDLRITGDTDQAISGRERTRRTDLQRLSGRQFDRAFLIGVRDEHVAEIAKVNSWYFDVASSDSVKTYLRDIMPTLVKHEQTAERLLVAGKSTVAIR